MSSGRRGLLDPKSADARISLPDADPDLLRDLDDLAAEHARPAAMVDVIAFEPGPWEPSIAAVESLYGLFIIDGLISRGVVIEGRRGGRAPRPGGRPGPPPRGGEGAPGG